jgi:hypothetical protein
MATRIINNGATRQLEITFKDHRAHWRRHGTGIARIVFEHHISPAVGWLSIIAAEHADTGASKATMITLDREQATELRQFLTAAKFET